MAERSRTMETVGGLKVNQCPSCGATNMSVFYEVSNVPVNSVLLLSTREEARNFPTGEIALAFCEECGFITNLAFDAKRTEYSSRYESTQAYSPTFNAFARRLAIGLIEKYDLRDKDLIEIGCGQGEFLIQLCALGNNRGVGFDPAYVADRLDTPARKHLTFVKDFYSEEYAHYQGDFVCCKMTLEHIFNTEQFVSTVRRSIGDRPDTIVFFQIPNAQYVLSELAFWDIYYEHCSYFSKGSLARLFRRSGFDVMSLSTDYDDQYLMIEARPQRGAAQSPPLDDEDDMATLKHEVAHFRERVMTRRQEWKETVRSFAQRGERVIVWGGGSKAVAFLTTLGLTSEVDYAVDINPLKHGTFLPVTGQEVVAPEFLRDYQPQAAIVMNPIYRNEVQTSLDSLGVSAELMTL